MYAFNPNTGQYLNPAGKAVIPGGPSPTAKLPKVNLGLSSDLGVWVDSSGNPIPNLNRKGISPPPTGTGTAGNGKTPTSSASNLVDKWYAGKQTTQLKQQFDAQGRPLLDSHGAPIYKKVPTGAGGQLNYQQGLQRLRAMGYSDEASTQLLNTKWRRGERGRPWLSGVERTALKSGNALPHARYHKGHAYLDRGQYNLLQLDDLLPQGEWVGNRYFIKPVLR
jgi:hypothetical protein